MGRKGRGIAGPKAASFAFSAAPPHHFRGTPQQAPAKRFSPCLDGHRLTRTKAWGGYPAMMTMPNQKTTRTASRPNAPLAVPSPPGAHGKAAGACKYCKASREEPVRLVASDGGEAAFVCRSCLRSLLLRKADLSQRRNSLILEAFAEENGLQVWCSNDVGYALPPVARPA
jgi:hypothetical protein